MSTTHPIHSGLSAFDRARVWLNSEPLTAEELRGRIVLVDIWTYSCVNWLRTLPYVRAWADRYRDRGLVVVGAHCPEFGFEHDLDNVRHATRELGVDYPVVIDNDFAIWQSLANRYWPAVYLVDCDGRIRYHHFGEGNYEETERAIQQLLGIDEETAAPCSAAARPRANRSRPPNARTAPAAHRARRPGQGRSPARASVSRRRRLRSPRSLSGTASVKGSVASAIVAHRGCITKCRLGPYPCLKAALALRTARARGGRGSRSTPWHGNRLARGPGAPPRAWMGWRSSAMCPQSAAPVW